MFLSCFRCCNRRPRLKILVCGSRNSGKTSFILRCKTNKFLPTLPTRSFNENDFEYLLPSGIDAYMTAIECPSIDQLTQRHILGNAIVFDHAVFMIDSMSGRSLSLDSIYNDFMLLLENKSNTRTKVALVVSKSDSEKCLSVLTLISDLKEVEKKYCNRLQIFTCSSWNGHGLSEILSWLCGSSLGSHSTLVSKIFKEPNQLASSQKQNPQIKSSRSHLSLLSEDPSLENSPHSTQKDIKRVPGQVLDECDWHGLDFNSQLKHIRLLKASTTLSTRSDTNSSKNKVFQEDTSQTKDSDPRNPHSMFSPLNSPFVETSTSQLVEALKVWREVHDSEQGGIPRSKQLKYGKMTNAPSNIFDRDPFSRVDHSNNEEILQNIHGMLSIADIAKIGGGNISSEKSETKLNRRGLYPTASEEESAGQTSFSLSIPVDFANSVFETRPSVDLLSADP